MSLLPDDIDYDVQSLLIELRWVHNKHIKRFKERTGKDSWSVWEQLLHVQSEVSEVYTALRKGPPPETIITPENNPWRDHLIDEVWDICFSAIAVAQILEFSDDEIQIGMAKCLEKIQDRVKQI